MIDRSDQVWMYNGRDGRFVGAYIHTSTKDHGHNVTVFITSDERVWEVGPVRWAEAPDDPWENDPNFIRLV